MRVQKPWTIDKNHCTQRESKITSLPLSTCDHGLTCELLIEVDHQRAVHPVMVTHQVQEPLKANQRGTVNQKYTGIKLVQQPLEVLTCLSHLKCHVQSPTATCTLHSYLGGVQGAGWRYRQAVMISTASSHTYSDRSWAAIHRLASLTVELNEACNC